MKRQLILALAILLHQTISAQVSQKDTLPVINIKCDCISILAEYSTYWIADSQAANGFRDFVATEIIAKCHKWKGVSWSSVSKFLGVPHYTFRNLEYLQKDEIIFRYVVLSYRGYKNYWETGCKYLNIYVLNDKIEKIVMIEVDG